MKLPRNDGEDSRERFARRSRSVLTRCVSSVARGRGEIATTSAIIGGWACLTYGLVLFTTPKVWPLSFGLLLLSGSGWRLLWKLATDGLYVLTRTPPRG